MSHPALTPATIGGLTLRNRFIKTATYEGMTPGGRVSEALIEHHAAFARRGVALTTVAYGAINQAGRTFKHQLLVDAEAAPALSRLATAVHDAGGAVSIQLSHCGGFSKLRRKGERGPLGPSGRFNAYGLAAGAPRVKAMTEADIASVIDAFGEAADRARRCGFDAVEIHCGHGYLLSQFLSPRLNRRRDSWGGSLERRLALPAAVLQRVRELVGPDYPVLVKLNLNDGVKGGLVLDEAVAVAKALAATGASALVPSGGLVQSSAFYLLRGDVPVRAMATAQDTRMEKLALRAFAPMLVKPWPYSSAFFFDDASAVLDAVDVPVALLGGVDSSEVVTRALNRGFEFVAMGRALLADPDFIERLAGGDDVVSRCNHCNLCIAEMDRGGVRCVLDN